MNTLKRVKKGITRLSAFVPSLLGFIAVSLSLFVSSVSAEIPIKFNYQGNLRQSGFLVNGQRSMVFRIYNSTSPSAVEIWTSPVYSVNVSTGVFRVTLEPVIADMQNSSLWLELEVEGNRMSPWEELDSSPYAINSRMISGKSYISSDVAPTASSPGDLWYNTSLNALSLWNGTAWFGGIGTGLVPLHAGTHSGTGSDPITSLGAHTVTGDLVLQGILNPSSNLSIGGVGYSVTFASSVTAGWFRGNGAALTNLNASAITSGLLSGDRIGDVIVSSHIVDGSILTQDLADGSVTKTKINQSGCAEGDMLKMSGAQWVCSPAGGASVETDPFSIHNQSLLQAGATFYVSSGTVNYLNVNNTLNSSSNLNVGGAGYSVTFASAVTAGFFYGDGSGLTNVGRDNLGNHIATTTLNMAGFPIINVPSLDLANNVFISSETSAALGAGVRISSNVYIVGFSSATRYYGDGSMLTGIQTTGDNMGNHIATTTLNMAGFPIINVPSLDLANNVFISSETSAALGAGVRISSNVYIVGFSSAARYYGDGSMLTGIIAAGDNLGNHIATTILNMAGFPISNSGLVTATGLVAAQLRLANNVIISSETSAALGAGVWISSNVYVVGFSSAARYYGDGSMLTGINTAGDNLGNHIATTTLNMSGFDIVGASTLTVSTITATTVGVNFSTNVFVSGNVGIGTQTPEAKLEVTSAEVPGEYIAVFHSGTKLAAWLKNK